MAKFKLFKTRELLTKYPWLDAVRMKFLSWVCTDGTTFFDTSYRVVKFVSPGAKKLLKEGTGRKSVMFAIYHGRMVGALGIKPRKRLTILISQSRDGEMIARGCLGLGFSVARGSPTLGAVKGALEMIDAVKSGNDIAFMVDGPRGPIFEVKPGIIRLAELAGTPIIPFVCSARSAGHMRSWDRFVAPWWATPVVYLFGEPITVPAECTDQDRSELHALLQQRMEDLRIMADRVWPATI